METYKLYYKDIFIGSFIINNDEYKYVPIDNMSLSSSILIDLKKPSSGKIIDFPFLESRLRNMAKFNLQTLKYVTDFYRLENIQ